MLGIEVTRYSQDTFVSKALCKNSGVQKNRNIASWANSPLFVLGCVYESAYFLRVTTAGKPNTNIPENPKHRNGGFRLLRV